MACSQLAPGRCELYESLDLSDWSTRLCVWDASWKAFVYSEWLHFNYLWKPIHHRALKNIDVKWTLLSTLFELYSIYTSLYYQQDRSRRSIIIVQERSYEYFPTAYCIMLIRVEVLSALRTLRERKSLVDSLPKGLSFWCFDFIFAGIPNKFVNKQFELQLIWDTVTLTWPHCNDLSLCLIVSI